MTGYERVVAAIERRGPDRVPMGDAWWEDTLTRWRAEGLPADADLVSHFDLDIAQLSLDPSPRFPAERLKETPTTVTLRDRFGYTVTKSRGRSRTVDFHSHAVGDQHAWSAVQARFAEAGAGLAEEDRARLDTQGFPFRLTPEPNWAEAAQRLAGVRAQGRYVTAAAYGPHEATWRLRGFTETLMDLATAPDFVADIAATYTGFLIDVLDDVLRRGLRVDAFFMVEDIAYGGGLLFAPQTWRRVYRPCVERLGSFLHEHGLAFFMHGCGNAEALFDALADCGVQVMQPLEAKAGLDVRDLVRRYGQRLTLYGNIDAVVMGSGSDGQVEAEIRDKLAAFGPAGGYLYHSDHSVPPEVSLARYEHVLACVRRHGTFTKA